jgi:tripartite-type tricarboxylate transporter receptor subunit TctC
MLTDLVGGQVQVAFDPLPASIEHVRAGKLRALAVATAEAISAQLVVIAFTAITFSVPEWRVRHAPPSAIEHGRTS